MDKIIKHNDGYCHIDNTSIIFDDEEYDKFNEICQIFNVKTITIGSRQGDKNFTCRI